MPSEQKRIYKFPVLRHLPRDIRRARLVIARSYPAGYAARKGVLSGSWDGGEIMRAEIMRSDVI